MFDRRVALAAILLLGMVLRLIQLDAQPLWWDEGYSVFFATRDFGTLLARTAIDIHPPLYYALMQLWMLPFGKDPLALRLLSVVIGVVPIPLLYLVARNLFDRRTALVAAFLLAIAPLQVYYSQELRMYGLVTLLALASVALQLKILTKGDQRAPTAATGQTPSENLRRSTFNAAGIGYVFITAALLYTQYLSAFLVAAQIAVVLYLKYRARCEIALRRWLYLWLAAGLLYLPWVIYAGPKLYAYVAQKVGIEQYARLDPLTYLAQHLAAFSIGHLSEWTWLAWGAIVFVALAFFGFLATKAREVERDRRSAIRNALFATGYLLTGIYLLVPLALGFLVNLIYSFHPMRYERLLLFVAPFFLMLVARGIVALYERQHALGWAAAAVVALLCALALYDFYSVERYPDEDYRPLIREMEHFAAPNDLVYAFYPWQIGYLEAYYHGAPLNVYEIPGDVWIGNADGMNAELERLRREHSRAWILAYQKQGRILENRVTNEYVNDYLIADAAFGNTRLEYFAQGNATDFELPSIAIAPDLTLRPQYAAFEPQNEPALALARFAWDASSDAYAYSLRVVDATGSKIAQQDAPIPIGTTTLRRALALPQRPAAGEYTLQLVAYRRADGTPLTLPDASTAISLAKITLAPP